MTFIRELINGMKAAWHSGRGHKATRRGKYETALRHYELAVEYEKREGKYGSGPNPVALECIARTQARLGNYTEALLAADRSMELYKQLKQNTKIAADCTARVDRFINLLKTRNEDEIKKFLII